MMITAHKKNHAKRISGQKENQYCIAGDSSATHRGQGENGQITPVEPSILEQNRN